MTGKMRSKYDRLIRLSTAVVKLEALHPSLKWKVTDLARITKVPRSVIYECLGKNKGQMLEVALTSLLAEVYGFSEEKRKFDKENGYFVGLLNSRNLVLHHPEVLSFYYRNRNRTDEIGEIIRSSEKKCLDYVASYTGLQDPTQVLFIRTMLHGVSVSPFLNEKQMADLMKIAYSLMKSKPLD